MLASIHDKVGDFVTTRNVGVLVVSRDKGTRVVSACAIGVEATKGCFDGPAVAATEGTDGALVSPCIEVGTPIKRLDGANGFGTNVP